MDETYGQEYTYGAKIADMMASRLRRQDESVVRMEQMDTDEKVTVTYKGTGLAARVLYTDGHLITKHKKRTVFQFEALKKRYAILAEEKGKCRDRLEEIEKEMLKIDLALGRDHS